MLPTGCGRPGVRRLLVSYLPGASLRWLASIVAGVIGKISAQRLRGIELRQRGEPQPVDRVAPDLAEVAAEHRVLVAECQQLSILRQRLRDIRTARRSIRRISR